MRWLAAIGAAISIWMPMTAIPQRTAISHAFGALAATLVGIEHYEHMRHTFAAATQDISSDFGHSRCSPWASK